MEITNHCKKSSSYIIIKSVPIFHRSTITAYLYECMGKELLQSISQKETPNFPRYPGIMLLSLETLKQTWKKSVLQNCLKAPIISNFLKENKKLEKKFNLSKVFVWVELAFILIKSYR